MYFNRQAFVVVVADLSYFMAVELVVMQPN